MKRKPQRLLFVATEDWFVRSHFQPMLQRAMDDGAHVTVAARASGAHRDLERLGVAFAPLDLGRSAMGPNAVLADRQALQAAIARHKPDLVHAVALKAATLAAILSATGPMPALTLAVTGLGYLAAARSIKARVARRAALTIIGGAIRSGRAVGLFENADDVRAIEACVGALPARAVFLAPGAGVDPAAFPAHAAPPAPPVRVGLVARMIRSKGVDLAVEAVRLLRAEGLAIELDLAGAPDPDNPGAISADTLAAWSAEPGVTWRGRIEDVAGFWAERHIACLPSRGGEGLPRSLLEAGACARPIVTTDVPGCRDLVRDGIEGRVCAPDSAPALADALRTLALDADLRTQMGAAARARIIAGYTLAHVQDVAAASWSAALSMRRAHA